MSGLDRRTALAAAVLAGGLAAGAGGVAAAPRKRTPSVADQLDMLVSRTQVEEVLMQYARGNDHADEAMIRDCFWPESTHKHGGFDGKSQDFVGFAMKILVQLKYCAHHISNVSIRVNGDRAFSECYYFAHHRRPVKDGSGEEDVFFEGRYLDFHERRSGVWKIIRRRGLSDYTSTAMPANTPFAQWPAGTHTERSSDDEWYRMLAQFEGK